jgi:hypothetical protein
MRVGCLERVPYMRFDLFVFILTLPLPPCLCRSLYFYATYYSHNTISLFYVYCKTFLISADRSVWVSIRNRSHHGPTAHFVDPTFLLMSLLVLLSWWGLCSPYATADLSSLSLLACAVFDYRSWDCDPWSPCAAKYDRYSRDRWWRLAVVNFKLSAAINIWCSDCFVFCSLMTWDKTVC